MKTGYIMAVPAEPPLVAVSLFHLRNGRIVDRREWAWASAANCWPRPRGGVFERRQKWAA